MRKLAASAIFVRFIFGRQNWKFKFENVIIKIVTGLSPALKRIFYIIALAASNVKNLEHFLMPTGKRQDQFRLAAILRPKAAKRTDVFRSDAVRAAPSV
jgi:hypothetical protein